ncbi:MAG: hypothetical protein WCF67_17250 [Chitinophagaceae bacterium]
MQGEYEKFKGQWIYRSLRNDTDINIDFNQLEFGRGTIHIDSIGEDFIAVARLDMGSGYQLSLKGELSRQDNEINSISLKGEGISGTPTEGWRYDYQGFVVPAWPNGKDQAFVITGSVIRVTDHGTAKAGYVGSFYMVHK